jgi:hypothetical protein
VSKLQFIAALAGSLAWPLAVVAIALLFRSKLLLLLSPAMKRLKIGPIEAEWDRQAATTEVELEQARVSAPEQRLPSRPRPSHVQSALDTARSFLEAGHFNVAVIEGFGAVERSLHALLMDANVSVTELHVRGAGMARLAEKSGLVTHETANSVEGLAVLKNLAAMTDVQTSAQRAENFLALVEGVLFAIENPTT